MNQSKLEEIVSSVTKRKFTITIRDRTSLVTGIFGLEIGDIYSEFYWLGYWKYKTSCNDKEIDAELKLIIEKLQRTEKVYGRR